jgi:hypothetical protein
MSRIKSFMSDLPTPDTGIADFEFELETKGNPMTPTTLPARWFIRTNIQNYWAFDETPNTNTFIATPASQDGGTYAMPVPVTFECEYILEQNRRDIAIRGLVEHASDIFVIQPHGFPVGVVVE